MKNEEILAEMSDHLMEEHYQNFKATQTMSPVYDELKKKRIAAGKTHMSCSNCGQDGWTGEYPFSTAPSTGRCDDCL